MYIDELFANTLLGKGSTKSHLLLQELMKSARDGHLFLKTNEASSLLTPLLQEKNSPLVLYKDALYLRKNWDLETLFTKHMQRFLKEEGKLPSLAPPKEDLTDAQHQAYKLVPKTPLLILSGGPGCGKTFLANEIMQGLLKVKEDASVIFTAPTAKAAGRISHPRVTSKTLHSLLGLKESIDLSKKVKPITCDLIIIDECSMIDIKLWVALFSSLNPNAHILLMGDPDQLPPVETIGIFQDLVLINKIPHVHLDIVKRTDSSTLQNLNLAVKKGDFEKTLSILEDPLMPSAKLFPLPRNLDPFLLLPPDTMILTPFNKGPFGTEALNEAIDKNHPIGKKPIIITKNDYRLGLMNGERGYLKNNEAFFMQNGGEVSYPSYLLSSYELAYAISIHKSQGSEFSHVYLILPDSSETFTREMVYTGITRAKKSVTVFANKETLEKTLQTTSKQETYLKDRLEEALSS